MFETFSVRLVRGRLVTPRVRELVFERVDEKPFLFKAGQWVSLRFPLVDERQRPVRRSYSVASVPDGSGRFELIVTKVEGGPGSTWLHEAKEGATIEAKGPQGTFLFSAEPAPSLLIATGTGIAPFRGMVRQALDAGGSEPLWVLFGVRSLADALYREEFEALAKVEPRVRFELTLSRGEASWTGRRGYVQAHVEELWAALSGAGRGPQAYVCGVKKMLTEVREVLRVKLGVERQRVHLESYD
jgi:CDP-4-dehydro-6-deoxyglucose reductase, E3